MNKLQPSDGWKREHSEDTQPKTQQQQHQQQKNVYRKQAATVEQDTPPGAGHNLSKEHLIR